MQLKMISRIIKNYWILGKKNEINTCPLTGISGLPDYQSLDINIYETIYNILHETQYNYLGECIHLKLILG